MPGRVTTSRGGSTPCARRSRAPSSATAPRSPVAAGPARSHAAAAPHPLGWLLTEAVAGRVGVAGGPGGGFGDADLAASSEETEEERTRLIALVELARKGDSDAFGMLYDHYQGSVYRFLFYRTRSSTAGRGPHLGDLLPGAAQHAELPLAGQGLRRLADDHRPQPRHRPLQGRPHPPRADHRGHGRPRRRHRGPGARRARRPHQRDPAQGAHRAARASSATA